MEEKTSEYYLGRESILRENMDALAKSNIEQQAELFKHRRQAVEMSNTIAQLEAERNKCQIELQSKSHNLERWEVKGKEDEQLSKLWSDKFKGLLEWVMNIDNRSAEERLRDIRAEYLGDAQALGFLKPGQKIKDPK